MYLYKFKTKKLIIVACVPSKCECIYIITSKIFVKNNMPRLALILFPTTSALILLFI
jgi:hypothetical protein